MTINRVYEGNQCKYGNQKLMPYLFPHQHVQVVAVEPGGEEEEVSEGEGNREAAVTDYRLTCVTLLHLKEPNGDKQMAAKKRSEGEGRLSSTTSNKEIPAMHAPQQKEICLKEDPSGGFTAEISVMSQIS